MIYIASSIANIPFNSQIAQLLRAEGLEVAVPHELCPPSIAHNEYRSDVFRACTDAMERSYAAVVNLDSCGNDSSWECGWFHGRKRPVIGVVQGTVRFTKDFMVKGSLTGIVTTNPLVMDYLKADPMLSSIPVRVIDRLDLLASAVTSLLEPLLVQQT